MLRTNAALQPGCGREGGKRGGGVADFAGVGSPLVGAVEVACGFVGVGHFVEILDDEFVGSACSRRFPSGSFRSGWLAGGGGLDWCGGRFDGDFFEGGNEQVLVVLRVRGVGQDRAGQRAALGSAREVRIGLSSGSMTVVGITLGGGIVAGGANAWPP